MRASRDKQLVAPLLTVVLSAAVVAGSAQTAPAGGIGEAIDAPATQPAAPAPAEPPPARQDAPAVERSGVIVNGRALDRQTVEAFARRWNTRIAPGDYWYDRHSGAWGLTGGPTVGFILPNLALGGELRADASNGDTGVFINGRQLHRVDVILLSQIVPVYPGRYWVDANGLCGIEGNPRPLVNLAALARSRQSVGTDRGYNRQTAAGGIGGDGDGNFYFIDSSTGSSVLLTRD